MLSFFVAVAAICAVAAYEKVRRASILKSVGCFLPTAERQPLDRIALRENMVSEGAKSAKVEQSDAITLALGLPLPDAVYEIIRYNEARFSTYLFIIDLSELLSKWSLDELVEWEVKSKKLRRSAYPVADAGLSRNGNYEEARAIFISENPGFGERSYEDAIRLGFQQAR